jgi:predicted RNA methylase
MRGVTIASDVADVLRRSSIDGNTVRLPAEQLERPLYAATDKVLKALGGKWNRSAGAHVFPREIQTELTAALDQGHAVDQKKSLEQFFTPPDLAERMCQMAGIADGMHVLEPEAGSGRIVLAALDRGARVTAVEIDPIRCKDLTLLFGFGAADFTLFGPVDFMTWAPPGPVAPIDAVVMNPPFSRGQDIAHVRRAFEMLRPGGTLVAVMSPHWTFATDRASIDFRHFLAERECLDVEEGGWSWRELPEGTFKDEGTAVNTGLLVIRKAVA